MKINPNRRYVIISEDVSKAYTVLDGRVVLQMLGEWGFAETETPGRFIKNGSQPAFVVLVLQLSSSRELKGL